MKESPEQQLIWEKYTKNLEHLRSGSGQTINENYLRDVLGMEPEDFEHDDPDQAAMDRKEGGAIDGDEEYGNKMRGAGDPYVEKAGGHLRQALAMIENKEIHLCADKKALELTLKYINKAKKALLQNVDEVPGE